MKILILSDDFPPRTVGGPAIVASSLALELKKQGHTILVLTTVRAKQDAGQYTYNGLEVIALHSDYHPRWRAYRSLYNPAIIGFIKKYIQEFKPDVVHAHNIHYHISYHALKCAKKLKVKSVVLTAHDVMLFHYGKLVEYIHPEDLSVPKNPEHIDYHVSIWQQLKKYKRWYNPFRNIVIRYYLTYIDHVCVVSNAQKNALVQNGISRPLDLVYNGIDPDVWKPNIELGTVFRQHHGLQRKKIILFAGRLNDAKGAKQVLNALTKIVEKVPDAIVLVVGTKDAYAQKMEQQAVKLGIASHIVFTGWLQHAMLQASYNAADVVIFPSICFDTFGMVNIEAMAVEKPVVATCFGGAREVVEDAITGTIVNPLDTNSLATAVTNLLSDSITAQKYGKAGRERVKKLFTLEHTAQKYVTLYTKYAKNLVSIL